MRGADVHGPPPPAPSPRRRGEPVQRPLALPEIRELRQLRRALAFGGLPPAGRRSPEDCARISSFRVLEMTYS